MMIVFVVLSEAVVNVVVVIEVVDVINIIDVVMDNDVFVADVTLVVAEAHEVVGGT